MKRVYLETNFIIDLLRPLKSGQASALSDRFGKDVAPAIPWCCFKEAERTLPRIIQEDLAFTDNAGSFLGLLHVSQPKVAGEVRASVNRFLDAARGEALRSHSSVQARLRELQDRVECLGPNERATELTIKIGRAKELKPVDEMILGSVLADAERLSAQEKYFCSLNRRDFEPTTRNDLQSEYQRVGVTFAAHFRVP